MPSLSLSSAKQKFALMLQEVGAALPAFAVWVDLKMAEYKVTGTVCLGERRVQGRVERVFRSADLKVYGG